MVKLLAEARTAKEPEAQAQQAGWIEDRASEAPKSSNGRKKERETQLRDLFQRAVTQNRLLGDFVLHSEKHGAVTVAQILDDPDKFHGVRFADPLEPDFVGLLLALLDGLSRENRPGLPACRVVFPIPWKVLFDKFVIKPQQGIATNMTHLGRDVLEDHHIAMVVSQVLNMPQFILAGARTDGAVVHHRIPLLKGVSHFGGCGSHMVIITNSGRSVVQTTKMWLTSPGKMARKILKSLV